MKFYSIPIFNYLNQSYSYKLSKKELHERLSAIFDQNSKEKYSSQYTGNLSSNDTFELAISHVALIKGFLGKTKLVGHISSEGVDQTTIEIKIKPAIGYYVWFILGIIFGIVYIFQFIDSRNLNYLVASAFSLIIVPFLFVQIFKVFANALKKRFEKHIAPLNKIKK
jgi:hypothetical protein